MPAGARKWIVALLAVAAITPAFVALFHPPEVFMDTYDYMWRGWLIRTEGAHPFGFGLVLRALSEIAPYLWHGSYPALYQSWQIACAVFSTVLLGWGLSPRRRGHSVAVLVSAAAWLALTLWVFLPGIVFFANGYSSELTSFLFLALGASTFGRALATDEPKWWAAFAGSCLVGYYVRYQLVVVPVAAALVVFVRFVREKKERRKLAVCAAALLALAVAVPASQRALSLVVPVDAFGKPQPEICLRKNIQCHLGCRVHLFETSCDTPAGKKLIDESSCFTMLWLTEDVIGKPYPAELGLLGTLRSLRSGDLLEWLVVSPARYLHDDQAPFDVLGYAYDAHVSPFRKTFPGIVLYYAQFIPGAGTRAPAFGWVVEHLQGLFERSILKWIAVIAFWGSVVGVVRTRDATAACLYGVTVGTLFIFAYFQPQTSVRYLLHIALPAYLASSRQVALLLGSPGPSERVLPA